MPTLGATLVPVVARSEGVPLASAQWIVTITLLAGTVATPVVSRLGDGAHRERLLTATLGCMVLGCLLSASASTFAQLLVGRGLQGVGFGTLPLAIAITRDRLVGEPQRAAVATISLAVAVGTGLGYPITAVVAELGGYHMAYWFGAGFSTLALLAVRRVMRGGERPGARAHLDAPGAVLLGAGLAALLLGVSRAATWGWGSPRVLALLAAGTTLLAAWGARERRVAHPLVDLRLARLPVLMAVNLTAFLIAAAMWIAVTLVALVSQAPTSSVYGLGGSVLLTGLLFLPLTIGALASRGVVRLASRRFGAEAVMPGAAILLTAGMLVGLISHDHVVVLALIVAVIGLASGGTFAIMPVLVVGAVPGERTGSAMGLNLVLRTAGGAVGSAIGGTVLGAYTVAGTTLPRDEGVVVAFALAAALSATAAVLVAALARRTVSS